MLFIRTFVSFRPILWLFRKDNKIIYRTALVLASLFTLVLTCAASEHTEDPLGDQLHYKNYGDKSSLFQNYDEAFNLYLKCGHLCFTDLLRLVKNRSVNKESVALFIGVADKEIDRLTKIVSKKKFLHTGRQSISL